MIIKLTKEYELGNKKYKEIDLKLEDLNGADLMECSKNYKARMKSNAENFKDFDDAWALTVAEKASGVKYGHLLILGAEDFLKVVNQTKNFLAKGWGTLEEEAPTTEE